MDRLYKALYEIENLLIAGPTWTKREGLIYSITCAALNLEDGEAIMQAEARAFRRGELETMGDIQSNRDGL